MIPLPVILVTCGKSREAASDINESKCGSRVRLSASSCSVTSAEKFKTRFRKYPCQPDMRLTEICSGNPITELNSMAKLIVTTIRRANAGLTQPSENIEK